ncbi:glycerol-3-phosphate 1-O-acyltransferase PlsY [Evansella sp. AB-P1]|uniref:glycerol-3-phosphate 1-O-acyltransferase PlsY n=1 Tax=Evansella sp. AB-P1 TaxID=3037653 RepID=UPI00241BE699|nr:glycerol-3-phosphate 1-O-acyltransferase PlsY [Evansella sp. AB-P1]MDG5787613.1 glycerol-3-phosphate 1-O-acyltransferase PlsY [Evansella sp. AB-P1]
MFAFISILISYLLGSVSFSYLIAKKIKKVDIRQHGSGNAGATNTLRVLGIGPAIAVLLLDCAKGIVAVVLAFNLTSDPTIAAASGLASIIGHNWPIYYGFRGGKGVATTIGVLASLVLFAALISGVIAIITIIISRYVSLGSIIFITGTTVITVFFSSFFSYPVSFSYFTVAIAILSIWRHRTNIVRLVKGNESKIGEKVKAE